MLVSNFKENEDKRIGGIESISLSFNKIPKNKISTIIPTSGSRLKHIVKCIESLMNSKKDFDVEIILIQYSEFPTMESQAKELGANYIFVETKNPFNKSLAMNIGSLYVQSRYLHFHDCDIMVDDDFYQKIFEKIDSDRDLAFGLQTFKDRRVLYINESTTDKVFEGTKTLEDIIKDPSTYTAGNPGAPGGSLLVSSLIFHLVGGFDFCVFEGYGAEDELFWRKISMSIKVNSLDDVEIYHLFHSPNNDIKTQTDSILGAYEKMPHKGPYLELCRNSMKLVKDRLNRLIINADIRYIA